MPNKALTTGLFVLLSVFSSSAQQQQPPAAPQRPAQQPQRPAEQPQPPITFKVEVNYVEIDAVVTDADGNFVRNLTKDDFQIVEQGKPQTLSICSLVDIPVERADAPLFRASPIEPDVRSNRKEFDGRIFVLVLDDLHTLFSRTGQVRAAAKQFVERLGANDIAAIVPTGGNKSGAQEFTSSKRLLLRAVDNFAGRKLRSATLEKVDDYNRQQNIGSGNPPRDQSEAERAHNARNSMATLKNVAEYLAGVRGRRKAVVFFSEGIDYDVMNPIQNQYASDIREETRQAIDAASRSNVSFYGVDPRGLGGLSDEAMELSNLPPDNSLGTTTLQDELRLSQDSLRIISDETGGFAAVNQNDLRTAFSRILDDNSSYYVLGYYSSDERRDGRFRSVEVRVTKPGLRVRARKGYVGPKGRAKETVAANSKTSAALREALDSPVPVSGLGLSVFASPLKGPQPNASVAVTLEVDGTNLKFNNQNDVFTDDVEIAIVAIDQTGKIRDGGHDVMNLRLKPQTHEVVSRTGVRIARRLEVPPGKYQLRVGVRESGAGAVGSVLYDLEVPDFSKSDLSMSGILLTSAYASRIPTANPDPDFKQVLPAQPVALREFPSNDNLALFVEVYDTQVKAPHRVAIKTTILDEAGKALVTTSDERRSEDLQGGKGGYGYQTTLALKDLPPGRYVLRVEAQTLLKDGGTASRELEFRVR
ncbi:MAG TPA: VWA domain-containing protein [Vicinamibacterales bacterium]|jgi:VWFA-related protein|nr:VWA domain-containing protein [Vicinamibacterales bacterium]